MRDLPPPGSAEIHTVCDIGKSLEVSDGELVRIRGKIGGYHEVFLHSDDCSETAHFIELQLGEREKKRVMELSKAYRFQKPDIRGEVIVSGKLYRGAGRLYTYPARPVALNKSVDTLEPIIVDKLTEVKVEEFNPE